MNLDKEIINKLKTVIDPEVRKDVYSLKLVYDIEIDEKEKSVKMKFKPTVYHCPIGIQLALAVKTTLMEIKGLNKIDVEVIDFYLADEANKYLQSLEKK